MNTIRDLIKAGESDILEFKSNFDKEAIETLVAFANARSGVLLIGVADSGEVTGVELGKETVQNWVNQVKQSSSAAIIPDVEVHGIGTKTNQTNCRGLQGIWIAGAQVPLGFGVGDGSM